MAKKPRKVELYEVLSNRRSESGLAEGNSPDAASVPSRPLSTPARTGREVVLSLDLAFVIFVIVLALLATSFMLGVQRGEADAFARFTSPRDGVDLERENLDALDGGRRMRISTRAPEPGLWTLRLKSSRKRTPATLAELKNERRTLLLDPTVREHGFDVFVLDKGQGGVYSLSLGVFAKAGDEQLNTLKAMFSARQGVDGKAMYPDLSAQQFGDLGEAVE